MTISEFIKELNAFPPDMEVFISKPDALGQDLMVCPFVFGQSTITPIDNDSEEIEACIIGSFPLEDDVDDEGYVIGPMEVTLN